jgi:hypothetical protein
VLPQAALPPEGEGLPPPPFPPPAAPPLEGPPEVSSPPPPALPPLLVGDEPAVVPPCPPVEVEGASRLVPDGSEPQPTSRIAPRQNIHFTARSPFVRCAARSTRRWYVRASEHSNTPPGSLDPRRPNVPCKQIAASQRYRERSFGVSHWSLRQPIWPLPSATLSYQSVLFMPPYFSKPSLKTWYSFTPHAVACSAVISSASTNTRISCPGPS